MRHGILPEHNKQIKAEMINDNFYQFEEAAVAKIFHADFAPYYVR